jgi:acyl carrier protein
LSPEQVFEKIRPQLAAILRKDQSLVTYEASLFDDLDAESIDLAEIEVVLEELYSVEVSDEQIEAHMMGDVTREEFYDEFYSVTETGLKQLETVIPRFNVDIWRGQLNMHNLGHILTIDALCTFISNKFVATVRDG